MLCRSLTAALVLVVLGGFALAETYRAVVVGLTDDKVSVLVPKKREMKPSEKKVLDLAEKVAASRPRGRGEKQKQLTLAEVRKLVTVVSKSMPGKGVPATVSTDAKGRVVAIQVGVSGRGIPEGAEAILFNADRIDFYSLDPETATKDPKALFHGWLILGQATLKEGKTRKQMLDVLDVSVGSGGGGLMCFDPRHGVRAIRGAKTVDMVICFRCGHVYFYYDSQQEIQASASVVKEMQPALDDILKSVGLPVAKARKE